MSSTGSIRKVVVSGLLISSMLWVGAGCSAVGKRNPSQEAAAARWSNARASVLATLARDQFSNGQLDDCAKTLRQAMALTPNDPQLMLLSGKLQLERGDLEQAKLSLEETRKLSPADAESAYLLGVVYQRWQQPQKALEQYVLACSLAPSELAYVLARSEVLTSMDQSAEAAALLEENLVRFENSAAIRDALGQIYQQMNQPAKAVDTLRSALMLAGGDDGIRERLAMALLQANRPQEALDTLNRLLRDEANAQRADLFSAAGEASMSLEKYRDARGHFEKVTALQPESSGAWLNLAKASMELGDAQRAEMALRRSLAMEPTSTPANIMLGYFRLDQGKYPEALAAFRRASKLDPTDTTALCMTGLTLEKMGKREEAVELYKQALKLNPQDDMADQLLADISE